jgi:threonyl-tRNA synthetase
MIKIKLIDNSIKEIEKDSNGFQLIKSLGVKDIVIMEIDGQLKDLSEKFTKDCLVNLISSSSEKGLNAIRHSTAHLLAAAVKEIYGNEVKLAIGPSIENGFYYDFGVTKPFSEKDFKLLEDKMKEISKKDEKFEKEIWTREKALSFFKNQQEKYKIELINEIPENEEISIYKTGNFIDVCKGPHIPSTRYLKNFKLTKVAGAYWRSDSKNEMLQRIYGTAWDSKEALDNYFKMLAEAEKRDHRKIGATMDLYHFEPEYAPGATFWHPKGLHIYNKLIAHIRKKQEDAGYVEVSTPGVMNRILWETSGHWEKYGEHNYSGKTEDEKQFCIKPMNCPGGILIYNQGIKSYKDLPIKVAEFGKVHRYEASGSLCGLMRVREFTQDDAHIYCTPEQVEEECVKVIKFILEIYRDFGFDNVKIKLSTRPEQRIGADEIWDISEKALAEALEKNGYEYTINAGEGAFYGPKLEFVLKDCIGRDWQCGTVQVDMNLPERFKMAYIGADGHKHQPVMLHRALLGSIERFLGMLIENCEGKLPLWLNPLQIVVANISEDSANYAEKVYKQLKEKGFQVKLDISNEKIGYKVREHSLQKVPYVFAVGKKEEENESISVRTLGNEKQEVKKLKEIINEIGQKIENKENGF